jgi:hypothetical protein
MTPGRLLDVLGVLADVPNGEDQDLVAEDLVGDPDLPEQQLSDVVVLAGRHRPAPMGNGAKRVCVVDHLAHPRPGAVYVMWKAAECRGCS